MLTSYFLLAFKNLKNRGLRSWLTILGVFIGIAAVVSLISLGQGLQTAITSQFSTLDVDKLIVQNTGTGFGPPGSTSVKKLNEKDLEIIESINGVDIAIPRIIRVVKVEFNNILQFRYITSVPQDSEEIKLIKDALNLKMELGRFISTSDSRKIVLGSDLADDSFEKQISIGSKIEIQGQKFEVLGILEKTSTFQINSVIFMTESDLKDLLDIDDEIDTIVVQVEDKNKVESVAESIERKLRQNRNQKLGEEDFSVQTPSQALESVNATLNIINLIVVGIAAISLLIGGIGIANTMYTSILERRKEIGTMKAIGAKNRDILAVFVIESGLLGLVGGIAGASAGLGLAFAASGAANLAFGTDLFQVAPSIPLLIVAISFSFLAGIAAGILPAYQASKLNPVEALRS